MQQKLLFCCVCFFHSFLQSSFLSLPVFLFPFVQVVDVYLHIRYASFVALDFLEVCFMGVFQYFRLFSECFKVGKIRGLIACAKYLCGMLRLPDLDGKSSAFSGGGSDV